MLRAVDGLTVADLDHLHDSNGNSIGSLPARVAAIEVLEEVHVFTLVHLARDGPQRLFRPWVRAMKVKDFKNTDTALLESSCVEPHQSPFGEKTTVDPAQPA